CHRAFSPRDPSARQLCFATNRRRAIFHQAYPAPPLDRDTFVCRKARALCPKSWPRLFRSAVDRQSIRRAHRRGAPTRRLLHRNASSGRSIAPFAGRLPTNVDALYRGPYVDLSKRMRSEFVNCQLAQINVFVFVNYVANATELVVAVRLYAC